MGGACCKIHHLCTEDLEHLASLPTDSTESKMQHWGYGRRPLWLPHILPSHSSLIPYKLFVLLTSCFGIEDCTKWTMPCFSVCKANCITESEQANYQHCLAKIRHADVLSKHCVFNSPPLKSVEL